MTAALAVWKHTEPTPDSLPTTLLAGYQRAESGDWQTGTEAERLRAWYGLTIETAYLMARLAGATESSNGTLKIYPAPRAAAPQQRRYAALVLYQTPYLLMLEHERSLELKTEVQSPAGETGFPALAVAGMLAVGVVVSVAQTAALAYVVTRGLELVHQELARRADLKQLVQLHATALAVVREHTAREDQLGRQIPLDPSEKAVLDGLNQAQRELARKQAQPLAPELDRMSSAAAGAIGWIPWILGGAAVGYVLITRMKKR
jgi:hypothetical protein